jgi:hypothetical protein
MRNVMIAASLFAAAVASAEIKLPQASPYASVTQGIGISRITVEYHRPGVKGRKIWGGLVPYGKVWRLGANNATTIELSHPMKVAGTEVVAGRYALFAIPEAGSWTMILNRKAEQWGAFYHDPKDDVLRFRVTPEAAPHMEWMAISLLPKSDDRLEVEIRWEKVRISFPIAVDTKAMVWKQIDDELARAKPEDWEAFHNAARYALVTGERRDEAMKWIDQAMKKESFWNYEVKARLLHAAGRVSEAYPVMDKAKALAKGKAPKDYIDGLDATIAEWRKQ